jgi:N6-adenosine-specific RNA methylase IME4
VKGKVLTRPPHEDFLPSEIDAIRRAMEPAERAAARNRMAMAVKGAKVSHPSRTIDRIGAVAGLSGRSVEKIAAIMDAARKDPKRFGPLVAETDRTRRVEGAYRTLRQWLDQDKRVSLKPVQGKFRTIVVDCPWSFPGQHRARPDYAIMTQDQLRELPIPSWADRECHLYVWSTNATLPQAIDLMSAWGFQYKTVLTWLKPGLGLGAYFRNTTEHCLFGVKGKVLTRPPHDIPTHFRARKTRHSVKPNEFYRLVERASYRPFLEVFARRRHPGWTAWGAGLVEAP